MRISLVRRLALIGTLAACAIPGFGQQPPPAAPPVTVPGGLNLNGASLLEVINLLAQDLHIKYVLDSAVRGGTVTINTYGAVRDVDLMPLLETILRMNNLAMVKVGDFYRIIPIANIARQPVSPITETDASKIPDDERIVLNLVFLRYVTSTEMAKILQPFNGDGAQMTDYAPANLLIILDNSRNMRRTLELVNLFDNDTLAGQRVRPFDVKFARPTDLAKDLDDVFKAYSLAGDKGNSPIHFIALDRINTIIAVSANPGTFAEVEKWIQKLDIPAKVTAGSIDNYVYKLRYARAEVMGSVVTQLYGGTGSNLSQGLYGGVTGNSSYPASNYPGAGNGAFGAGASPYGQPYGQPYGANYGSNYGGNYGSGYGTPYPGTGLSGGLGAAPGGFVAPQTAPLQVAGAGTPGGPIPTAPSVPGQLDQTGTYLSPYGAFGRYTGPRVIPNPFDNTLLIQGTPQQWEQIKNLMDKLDIPPRQVLIDAKIYEVDLTGDFSLGVESFLQKANSALPAGVAGHQLTGSNVAGSIALSAGMMVGQSRQLLALLQASESSSKAKVLSAPSIVATDSIPASITVGSSVPTISSESVSSGLQVNGTTPFTNTVSNTSTGIGLTILARVNPSGVVTMVINQNVTAPIANPLSAANAAGSNIDSPSFSQRNVSTQVTVEDGDTIAIGGIITDNTTDTSGGIPFLDKLPYIGGIFGTKTHHNDRTELIIFLTPRVIYDTAQMSDATEELKQKVRGLRRMIDNDK